MLEPVSNRTKLIIVLPADRARRIAHMLMTRKRKYSQVMAYINSNFKMTVRVGETAHG